MKVTFSFNLNRNYFKYKSSLAHIRIIKSEKWEMNKKKKTNKMIHDSKGMTFFSVLHSYIHFFIHHFRNECFPSAVMNMYPRHMCVCDLCYDDDDLKT